jgi:hypothetical protein
VSIRILMPRIAALSSSIVATLLGVLAGYFYGQSRVSSGADGIDLFAAAQSRYASYLFGAGRGDDRISGENEKALRAYLEHLDARATGASSKNVYAYDRALALIRLSDLARKRHNLDEAERLAGDAEAMCPSIGLGNCSANNLLATVRARDRKVWAGSEIPVR